MRTFKNFANFDKEETWLNKMADHGHLLIKRGFRYTFAPIAPGSATVRIDYRPGMSAGDFEDYRSLFADAGWRHIAGSRGSGTQYFASSTSSSNTDIFSDATSKAQRYRRAISASGAVLLPLLVVAAIFVSQGSIALDTFLAPRDWYLTPGLWDKQGWSFMGAFVFETPFVALRVAGPFLLLAVSVALLVQITYQSTLYRKALARAKV